MFKTKNTGRAIAISAIIVCVCFAMLLGTTFAWFTSTASTKVNTIVTGTFEIDIEDAAGTSLKNGTLSFVSVSTDASGNVVETPFTGTLYWEPGMVVRTQTFVIVNKGDYSVTCKLDDVFANGKYTAQGGEDLTQVISYEIKSDGVEVLPGEEFDLDIGGSKSFYIEFTMDTSAGNNYQNCSIEFDDAAVYVSAAQGPYDNDSNGTTYDNAAQYDDGSTKN